MFSWAPVRGSGCGEVASPREDTVPSPSAQNLLSERSVLRPGAAARMLSPAQDPEGRSHWSFPVPFISVL